MDSKLKFYDGFGDKFELVEDENPYIVDITITEDANDKGKSNKASCILGKEDALELANFIINKFK